MTKASEYTKQWRKRNPGYRKRIGEAKKYWQKIKSDPKRHEARKDYLRKWFRSYKRDYRKHWNIVYFNGNREIAVKRDNYKCVFCGISRREHKAKYNIDLHVHHVDGKGGIRIKKADRNSELSNLLTVCVRCHTLVHHGTINQTG